MTNLAVVLLLPALMCYHFVRTRGASIREIIADVVGALAGTLAAIFFYCVVYSKLAGSFNIFGPPLQYAAYQPHPNPFCPAGVVWIKHAVWLILPALAALVAIGFLFQKNADSQERSKYRALASATLFRHWIVRSLLHFTRLADNVRDFALCAKPSRCYQHGNWFRLRLLQSRSVWL
jgi:hypothetical protein